MKKKAVISTSVIVGIILIITLLMGAFEVFTKMQDVKPDRFRVTTYIRCEHLMSDDSLHPEDFEIITDVILFECAEFNNKGEVIYDETKMETALANVRKAIGDNDVNITLNLLGPRGTTDLDVWEKQMEAQSDEHNKAFRSGVLEDNIIAVLDKYDFDGVHFDYEYPLSKKAWRNYNRFLVSLDKKLGDYTLGVAASDWNINFTKSALNAIDTLELMTYDFADEEGKHATYEGTVNRINNLANYKVPAGKVNIGLPFYSRPTDMSAYWYGYNSYYESIDENGWYHCEETDKDFWFNTPEVIEAKTDYAINNGYGGVMMWHYNCDLPSSHEDSLLKAIDTATQSNSNK